MLETIEKQSHTDADAVVIWLHGLGADGNDFVPIVPQLGLADDLRVKFIFPHAPKQAVSINNGFEMRAWYDIKTANLLEQQDRDGIQTSQQAILELIQQQLDNGISSKRIILAGFSQGGAMALHTGLRFNSPLAGILSLSAYLPLADTVEQEVNEANLKTPIMIAHGHYDPVVAVQAGQAAAEQLQALGYDTQWHTYPMEHSVCIEEIQEIGHWINKQLRETSA